MHEILNMPEVDEMQNALYRHNLRKLRLAKNQRNYLLRDVSIDAPRRPKPMPCSSQNRMMRAPSLPAVFR